MIHTKEYHYLGLPVKSKSGLDNTKSETWWEYNLTCSGRRSVFTNVNAAIGLPQIKLLNSKLEYRAKLRKHYEELLTSLNIDFVRQECSRTSYSNYFFTILTSKRNELASFLRDNGIYTTFRYHPLHKIEFFSKFTGYSDFTGAEEFSKKALNIPIHNSLSVQDLHKISDKLKLFFS
jgi:dTDP-4-amino-4,6-dideoxygalactose transaminase